METLTPIKSRQSPREVLEADFEPLRGHLPIRGGWGYTREDACVIDKHDSCVEPGVPFHGVGIESVFVEKRIYEELIIFRRPGEQFSGIEWKLVSQSVISELERDFDRLVYEISAFRDCDWEELRAEFEGPRGYGTPHFDSAAHEKTRQGKMMKITREFWFDITSFYRS